MGSGGLGLAERRSVMVAAAGAMEGVGGVLHEAPNAELAAIMAETDAVVARAVAARAQVVAEAVRRGVVAESGSNAHAWVREHAPSLRQGGAGQVAKLATEVAAAGRAGGSLSPDAPGEPDPGSPLGMVWAGVVDGVVSPGLALSALGEVARLAPRLVPEAVSTVTSALLQLGVHWGPNQMRRLRPRLLAEHGLPGEFDDLQERLASVARLSQPLVESGDVTQYQLVVTPEQAAVLEAAIGPLSAPVPNEVTGQRDLRPAGQRRVEALAEVCRRSAGWDADRQGTDGPAGSPAALHVTMSLVDLQERTGVGEVLGSTATGVLLAPDVLRRVACDAALVPYVLGSAGEPLDLGRVVRLFTRAQRRLLWRRDRGCTFPRVRRTGVVGACASRAALGRWWRLGRRQRGVAVRAAPHRRAHPPVVGPGARPPRRCWPVRGVGPDPRLLRSAAGMAGPATRGARPADAHSTTTARDGRRPHRW